MDPRDPAGPTDNLHARRFLYEDNLMSKRYLETKKALITAPSTTPISTAFFSNNIVQDFRENYVDKVDERIRLTTAPTDPESSKESGLEPLTPLPPLKNLQRAFLSSEAMPLTYQDHSPRERPGLGTMKHTKPEHKNLQIRV
nr:retrovirus-related Pol polyprotein from transposon TNT 1-94 [Tanacetum cinerariifolium]